MLEYNVRFGDPETQVVLPRLASDLGELLAAAARGQLRDEPRFVTDAAVTVVGAAKGCPGPGAHRRRHRGARRARRTVDGVTVYCAGVGADAQGRLVTAGGRVLAVAHATPRQIAARHRAYEAMGKIHWTGMQFLTDIATSPGQQGGSS